MCCVLPRERYLTIAAASSMYLYHYYYTDRERETNLERERERERERHFIRRVLRKFLTYTVIRNNNNNIFVSIFYFAIKFVS